MLTKMKEITQVELERQTGILQPHISKYLNGVMVPTYLTAKKLADALEIDIDSFYRLVYEKRSKRNKNN